ncbi:MAG: glycosyltransferase [Paludibacter sp.]|nr:glycosyltransferase [Paludibacter sp.]
MQKKIAFLNTAHLPLDDRVYYHQAKCLSNAGVDVQIISTKTDKNTRTKNITINAFNDKNLSLKSTSSKIIKILKEFSPDTIICDTPLAVFASLRYKKTKKVRIIYDVTEWYPAKKNLSKKHGIKKLYKFLILSSLNFVAGLKSDSYIFGEYYKSLPFRILFFWKSFIFTPYYPNINYIQNYPFEKICNEVNLLYSGIVNSDKGIDSVVKATNQAAIQCPNILFNLQIIGSFPSDKDKIYFENISAQMCRNVHLNIKANLDFTDFCSEIGRAHIFFDLRKKDLENNLCLPIKLFYYLACGRPVIYSNLHSIRKEIEEFNFGLLVDPNDAKSIANYIEKCISNPEFYEHVCMNAYEISRNKYNWDNIKNEFKSFIYL